VDSYERYEERHLKYDRIRTWKNVFKKRGYKNCLFCHQKTTLDYDGNLYETGHEKGGEYENYVLMEEK
jgi:hypothetical protein